MIWRNEIARPEFEKNFEREAPIFANINLLGACNVDCYFCLGKDLNEQFKQHDQTRVHYTDWENLREFLFQCKLANIQRIYITGQNTDSLIYSHLEELVNELQDHWGFEVGLRTNGYLARWQLRTINKCKRNVGYSIHSLDPDTNWKIMRRKSLPDWERIIPETKNCRVSIVLNRHNESEFTALLGYVSKFPNVKYIQVRRICTDTREEYLAEDVEVYERVFRDYMARHDLVARFYGAEVINVYGKEVCFWRTVKTSIGSFNYYTDGTYTDDYFVIEGYMRDSFTFPHVDGVPVKPRGLEGYWRKDKTQ